MAGEPAGVRRVWDPPAPESLGPRWELTVAAGGVLGILDPPVLELGAVASLGRVLGGAGYVEVGVEVPLDPPEDSIPDVLQLTDEESAAALQHLQAAYDQLRGALGQHFGIRVPQPASSFLIDRPRRRAGELVMCGRSTATILPGVAGVGVERFDPSRQPGTRRELLLRARR
jgi:hypothetical protein